MLKKILTPVGLVLAGDIVVDETCLEDDCATEIVDCTGTDAGTCGGEIVGIISGTALETALEATDCDDESTLAEAKACFTTATDALIAEISWDDLEEALATAYVTCLKTCLEFSSSKMTALGLSLMFL
jgi:hypothetical protein